MAVEYQAPPALRLLRSEDLEVLLNLGWRRSYERGDTLVAAGERLDQLVLIEQGEMDLLSRQRGAEAVVRRAVAGQVIGTEALMAPQPAEHAIRAAADTIAIVFSPAQLEGLLETHPHAAARLGWAVATALAADRHTGGEAREASPDAGEPIAATPVGTASPQSEMLARLAGSVRAVEAALRQAATAPDAGSSAWLDRELPAAARLLDDLLPSVATALRGLTAEEARRLIRALRHELAPLLRRSRLADRMLHRLPDEPARFRSLDQIYRAQPQGDDAVGILVDAYLLSRPFAEAIRERRAFLASELNRDVQDRAAPDRVVRVLTLGSGPARSLADLLERPGMPDLVSLTCVDDDREALVHANNLLKSRAPRAEIVFRQASPRALSPETPGFGSYDVVATLFVADALDAVGLARMIAAAHHWLLPGGVLLLTALNVEAPDGLITDLLLDWRPTCHSPGALVEMLHNSPFGAGEVTVLPSGMNLWVRALKRG